MLRVILNSLRSLFKYKVFLVVYEKLNNSAFIIDIITVFYLFIFRIINPLKKCMVYPCKLFRLLMSFAKEAFVTISNLFPSPNLSFNMRVLSR